MEIGTQLLLAVIGFIGGFVGSEVGAGALITLPALLFLGLSPAAAVATNSLSAWLTNAVAAFDYARDKKIQWRIVIPLAPLALLGAIIGSELIIDIDTHTASAIIALLFGFVFLTIFGFARKGTVGMHGGVVRYSNARKLIAGILAFALGVYGGFFTVGVTTLFVMMLAYLLKRDFMQSAADSVMISAVFLLGSLITFSMTGLIDYKLALPLALGSVVGAHIGTKAAERYGNRWLRRLIFVIGFIVIIRLADQYIGNGGSALACSFADMLCK
jgi:uncharacterized membrane protein YfcA